MSYVEHTHWIVTTTSRSDVYTSTGAFAVLQQLRQTMVDEIDFYASRTYLIDPVECKTRIEAFHEWCSTEGEAILKEISVTIQQSHSLNSTPSGTSSSRPTMRVTLQGEGEWGALPTTRLGEWGARAIILVGCDD